MSKSATEWTDTTWNLAAGCTKVRPGLQERYAEWLPTCLHAMANPRYRSGVRRDLPS
ncbi:MAG: DUF5131 family protein [Rhodothermales bacterium]